MGLASLALERVLLVCELLVHLLMTTGVGAVLLDVLFVLLDLLLIHLAKGLHGKLDVGNQCLASAA